ncbi:hypothetical protein [Bacillus sp. JJ1773]
MRTKRNHRSVGWVALHQWSKSQFGRNLPITVAAVHAKLVLSACCLQLR